MNINAADFIKEEIEATQATLSKLLQNQDLLTLIEDLATLCAIRIKQGNKIIFAGNGGSAADSQHLAAELVSRLCYNRPGLPGIAITTDTSALTAIGNDYGYQHVFSRQIEAIGNPGDVLFAISTSGSSPNILEAIKTAKNKNITVIGFTGEKGGQMLEQCDYIFRAPSPITPKVQECHILIGHIICALIEEIIFGEEYNPKYKAEYAI